MQVRIAIAAACVITACIQSPALAATGADSQFPKRPVRLIAPVSPGGGTDFVARVLAQRLGERWGQTVVVDNRPGATGLIGIEILARAVPDGYTLAMLNVGYLLTAQLSGKVSFEPGGDFTPIALAGTTELLLVVYPGVPAKSVKELVELARAKPRSLNYASGGMGTTAHLGMELFRSITGIELTHVAYKGIGPGLPDLLSGRVQLTLTIVVPVMPHVQAGRLRGLAITGAKRLPTINHVPTFAEAGYPRFAVSVWWAVFGPARIPATVVAQLNADLNRVMQHPEVVDLFAGAGVDAGGGLSPAELADYMATEVVKWNEALKAARMR